MKRRNATGHNRLIDSVRGSNKLIQSDLANAEGTDATYVTSFNSDGWSIGTNTDINGTGGTAVGWSWLAGGSASSNTDGSITSSVSANTTSGFSIVSYTGTAANATVGHGLGAAPQVIFVKNRSAADDWAVYNYHIGATKYLRLNQNTAEETGAPMWNSTHPTSSVFSVGTYHNSNGPSENMIAYCFAEKKGYSKFGKYFGNNNTNGPFIYTGFKPAYVLFKIHSGTTGEWTLFDNKRDPFNEVDNRLFPSTSGQEADGNDCDFLSNGFKLEPQDQQQTVMDMNTSTWRSQNIH